MRKISRKGLIKKLDAIVTKILLTQEPQCVTCCSKERLGTSHIFSRKNYSTRWDIIPAGNCHIQCWPDNYRHSMVSTYKYNTWYISKFGQNKFDELYQRWARVAPMKTWQLQAKYEELKDTILITIALVITFFIGLRIQSLHDTNIAIQEELERARAEVIYVEPATIEAYVEYVFGPAFPKAMLLLKGRGEGTCAENRELKWDAVNDNTAWGGVGQDIGLFQISNKWQGVQSKFLFNWRINTLIAKQLFDESGGTFSKLWTCAKWYKSRGYDI